MKDQFVIACVESAESAAMVLPWARHFAECLNHKGVIAMHVKPENGSDTGLPEWLMNLGVPYVSMKGQWRTAVEGIPTAFNGILAVTAVNTASPCQSLTNPATLLREFKNCKTAYLCVSKPFYAAFRTPNTALTMTHRREGKEKLVWASYLARFLGSTVTIAHPDYRDQGLRQRWRDNMRFADKVYAPLGISYAATTLHRTGFSLHDNLDLSALVQLRPDLLVARTTDVRERDLIDLLTPTPEYRLLTHPSGTPLLFLNPRDDLYILCD